MRGLNLIIYCLLVVLSTSCNPTTHKKEMGPEIIVVFNTIMADDNRKLEIVYKWNKWLFTDATPTDVFESSEEYINEMEKELILDTTCQYFEIINHEIENQITALCKLHGNQEESFYFYFSKFSDIDGIVWDGRLYKYKIAENTLTPIKNYSKPIISHELFIENENVRKLLIDRNAVMLDVTFDKSEKKLVVELLKTPLIMTSFDNDDELSRLVDSLPNKKVTMEWNKEKAIFE